MQIGAHLTFPDLKELLATSLPRFGPLPCQEPNSARQRVQWGGIYLAAPAVVVSARNSLCT